MTLAAFFLGGAVALSLLAVLLGRMIRTGNPIDEHAMPFETDVELHRDVHTTRWTA